MDYADSLRYLYSFIDWERGIGYGVDSPPRFTLDRINALLRILGNPHQRFASVHVAGSKGKGSTAAVLESVLRAAGLRTGLYTQPHLHTFRERVRIDNRPIGQELFTSLVEQIVAAVSVLKSNHPALGSPTTYELATALGFLCFAEEKVDVAVVEVGLGGRLDATNVITPRVSVITSIGLEHTAILGDTLSAIAKEKAGIVKQDGVLVHAPNPADVLGVFRQTCKMRRARIIAADESRCEAAALAELPRDAPGACSGDRPRATYGADSELVEEQSVHGSTSSPRTGDTSPRTGNSSSGTGDSSPGTGETSPRTGNTSPGTGDASPGTGNSPPGTGHSSPRMGNTPHRTDHSSPRTDYLGNTEESAFPAAAQVHPAWSFPAQMCAVSTLGQRRVVRFPLRGRHQRVNLSVALTVIDELAAQGWPLSVDAVCAGIEAVRWPCRFEQLSARPLVIADGAHTPDAMACLRATLTEHYPGRSIHCVLGTNQDKDVALLLDALLPVVDRLIVCRSRHPRAQEPQEIATAVAGRAPTLLTESVEQGIAMGMDAMGTEDVLCVTGSLFVAAEAREVFGLAEELDPPLDLSG